MRLGHFRQSQLMRVALGIEYDGSGFHGWQLQTGARTVQSSVEQALAKVADHPVRVQCAGRTDAGVHARGQVVHFDTTALRSPRSWVLGGNANLPDDVALIWAREVPETFSARFSAIGRSYRYLVLNRRTRGAIERHRAVWIHRPLDAPLMHQAAQHLVGEHDFSSYRALGCQARGPVRRVTRLQVERQGELVLIEASANGFLHHMVRNIAGVLITIGRGDAPVDWTREVLGYRDRTLGGVTAPAQGLYLVRVDYPGHFAIPAPASAGALAPTGGEPGAPF